MAEADKWSLSNMFGDSAKNKAKEKQAAQSRRNDFIASQGGNPAQEAMRNNMREAHQAGASASAPAASSTGTGMDAGGYAQVAKMGMDAKGVGGANDDSNAGGFAQGAVGGAAMGSAILPGWGTAIGAVAGGVMGAAGAAAKRKAKNREVEAQKQMQLAQIEQNKGQQLNASLQSMAANMRLS